MCGIVGIVSPAPVRNRALLEDMRDTLRHRGPDDAGAWWSSDGGVGFGHRRLAILDLTPGGRQPMLDATGQVSLVFNGEIYNHADLRRELESQGARFRSTSDTEVLLEAYLAWGTDCLDRLSGMFAFAIWDGREKLAFLARDRAGEKPLYYHHDPVGGALRFASEIKALLADPAVPRRIDPVALNHYLAYGYVPGDACMLRGLNKLPQGCAMTYRPATGELHRWRYWQLPQAEPPRTADAEELTDRLEALLRESVRRQLVADVPVGVLLSGGTDSSLVTAIAAEVSSSPVRTFTIRFPGHGSYDEGPYARRVAEHFGTRHTELIAQPATVELLPALAKQYDEPMADSSMVPTYLVSRAIREHATVALGGDGGDELFGGYPPHRWVQQMQALRRFLPGPLREALRTVLRRWMPVGRFGRNFALGVLADVPGSITQINTHFDPAARAGLLARDITRRLHGRLGEPEAYKAALQINRPSILQRITTMDFRSYLVDDILVKVDRAAMLTSLEVRAPFLDPSIIEFAYGGVPDSLRATRHEKKILPRRLMERLGPTDLDYRRKQGFSLPLHAWFRGPWGDFCRDVLRDADTRLFRREKIETLLAQQRGGRRHTQRLFTLTMFELWRREYRALPPE
ncbi:MAG: asparagine synthase (glutamine-hydrolyzing) [Phycisphaerae bacterium]|nr:asparagine synthase (glutamine-hydrolyzing) [Phycisphaerae bacterium]